jgi:hypothetical protein
MWCGDRDADAGDKGKVLDTNRSDMEVENKQRNVRLCPM